MTKATSKVPVKKKKTNKTSQKKTLAKAAENVTPLASLREEVDNLFERFADDWPSLPKIFGKGWSYPIANIERQFSHSDILLTPRVDISETDDALDIEMELPGLLAEDIEITLGDDSLSVKGEKSEKRSETKKHYHINERSYGAFLRNFRVPNGVDRDKVEACNSNGVLKIKLPKTAAAINDKRSINVNAA
ncbi:MAG: Hsp20/alpha crystallin family protein [Gammaproteobacteria bacterium]|nr:Hsp20/alpha crystallin family protein [Gammaproteobacteria bacterium]